MKNRILILFFAALLFLRVSADAQIVAPDAFLQGAYLEIGYDAKGAFGTCSSPVGYHPHPSGGPSWVTGAALAEVYDWGHDGWSTGTPPFMGDYTQPGYPFEGWSVQIGPTEYRNWVSSGFCGGDFFVPGSITGYSNSGGRITGTWTGAVAGLSIVAEARVDTLASAVVVTVRFYNTTGSPIADVYYGRTCDPDNVSSWGGSGSQTHNVIVHQNEDAAHRVLVSSVGGYPTSLAYNLATYMGLGTKDCRAVCTYFGHLTTSYGLTPSYTPAQMWALTTTPSTYSYTLADSNFADIGYSLVYNIGTIAPSDSAIISFAYIFNGNYGLDSAFPEPQLVVNGVPADPIGPAPAPTYDTFNRCLNPGVSSLPVNIRNASDKCWSWSTWTWSPSIGLSSTTGVTNTINLAAISGPTTYTITGTDSATGMHSCNTRVMYLTILPCFSATNNSILCLNETLRLFAHGDSTGATYLWYGPGGYTAFTQYATRTGLTMTDTGWYTVVRYVGSATDTARTHVMLKPLPTVTLGSNAPICSGPPNTLLLTASLFATGETFSWTGPNAFASTLQNPSRANPPVSDGGIYKVVTTLNGCMDSGTINVIIDTTPAVPILASNMPVCSGHRDTLKLFGTSVTPGVTYSWAGPSGFTSLFQNPMIPSPHVPATGTYTVTVSRTASGITCRNTNTIAIVIDSTPYPPAMGSNAPICSGNALLLTSTSTSLSTYDWTGPNGFTSASQNPTISPASTFATGVYSVSATLGGCTSDTSVLFVQVDSTPEVPTATSNSPGPPVICQRDTLRLMANNATAGVTYSWVGPNSFTSTLQNPVIINVTPAATGIYTVTTTLGGVCSTATVTTVTITPTPLLTVTKNNPVCTGVKDTLFLNATSNPGATFTWTGPFVFTSSLQSPFRTPVVMEMGGIYQVIAYLNGCESLPVNDTIIIRQTPPKPWVKDIIYCQHYDAPRVQAFGDSVLWYPTSNISLGGSLIAPKPPTDVDTIMWYFATQTVMTCRSALDSFKITVHERPVVSILPQQNICPHEEIVLQAIDTDPMDVHHWSPMYYLDDTVGASVIARPITNITYRVVARNKYGCYDTAFTAITVRPGAVLYLGDSVKLYPGESYQIEPQTNCASFAWFPSAGLNNPFVSNPVATPQINTKYRVEGTTAWGCKATDSISIYVDPETLLTVPNAFVPGTGVNGEFKVLRRGIAELKYFRIWDRWGVKVFETTDINKGWDGTFNGKPQPFGVYIYEVGAVTSSGRDFMKHGNVTLIR